MRLTLALPLLLLGACRTPPDAPAEELLPPDGRSTRVDEAGVRRTAFSPLGVIAYGETRESELERADEFPGYEFFSEPGVSPRVTARLEGCRLSLLAVYGPQDEHGLWGAALASVTGEGELTLRVDALADEGMYFALMRCRDAGPVTYSLSLACDGCAEPSPCAQVPACDLVCDGGFVVDDFGCRACECVEPADCNDAGCPAGQVCGEDGECLREPGCEAECPDVVDPVCGVDGRTYPNGCIADCDGIRHIPGACPMEPGECNCAAEPFEPMCAASGRQYRNLCSLMCADEELLHPGRCVERPCRSDEECHGGWRCVPARVPGNEARCADPESPDCVRECQPGAREAQVCSVEAPGCDDPRTVCYISEGARRGFCLFACDPDAPRCPRGLACGDVSEVEGGVCLFACGPRGECPGGLHCVQGDRGEPTCQPCGCPDVRDPVCAGGRQYQSACHAECVGVADWEEGACGEICEARCADEPVRPVCGFGRTWRNTCVASCFGIDEPRPGACDARSCPRWCEGDLGGAVCVDGEDLDNPCLAACHGANEWDEGRCEAPTCDEQCAEAGDEPVCADGQTLRNACVARCEGFAEWSPGRCVVERNCTEECAAELPSMLCADGAVYGNLCEARCAGTEEPERLPGACWGGAELACRVDEDCQPTGCDGSVCAAAPTRACAELSPLAGCLTGSFCGCNGGRCGWRPDETYRACLADLLER